MWSIELSYPLGASNVLKRDATGTAGDRESFHFDMFTTTIDADLGNIVIKKSFRDLREMGPLPDCDRTIHMVTDFSCACFCVYCRDRN